MRTATLDRTMSDKQTTATIRVDEELRDKLKVICVHSKDVFGKAIKATEYIDQLIRASIERDYEKTMDHLQKSREGKKKS